MSFEVVGHDQASRTARQNLRVGIRCAPNQTRFELLRSVTWAFSAKAKQVHISRILNAAIPCWRLLSELQTESDETLRHRLREALEALRDAGDLVEAASGRWSPSATRLVSLAEGGDQLLVGGAPISILPLVADDVEHHGPFRIVKHSGRLGDILPRETLEAWTRLPPVDVTLTKWSIDLLDAIERVPYTPNSTESFEYYMPAMARRSASQFNRWRDDCGKFSGTALVRRARIYGAREFRVVDLVEGRPVRIGEIPFGEVRRLMYALDAVAGNPVTVKRKRVRDGVLWIFTSELPRPEQRLLAALGTLEVPVERVYERRWTIRRGEEVALKRLQRLGIEVLDQGGPSRS